jgi:hypothetical protein
VQAAASDVDGESSGELDDASSSASASDQEQSARAQRAQPRGLAINRRFKAGPGGLAIVETPPSKRSKQQHTPHVHSATWASQPAGLQPPIPIYSDAMEFHQRPMAHEDDEALQRRHSPNAYLQFSY